ncbi:MAG: response regulator [Candidatus Pacebacteria bacterium]|nr:response regulator [Candidatus Paceibacterota bacterium]
MEKKILLIEDDFAIIDIYKTVLETNGFDLEVITWGEKALEKIEKVKDRKEPKSDIVLLDLILPDMNGIEILRKIKGQEETKDLPVFILTNYDSKDLAKEAKSLNVEDFILKTDCTPSELIKLIKKKLKLD